jgi:hypothetical protein
MFNLRAYTAVHVVISLIALAAGLAVAAGLLKGKQFERWTPAFFVFTVLTSLTGFGFPFDHVLPSHLVGALSLVILAIAIYALYGARLAGGWRLIYVIGAMLAFYFNVFVLVVQLFQKVPALKAAAPTQSEPPFAVTQLAVLIAFVVLTVAAGRRFRPARQRGVPSA